MLMTADKFKMRTLRRLIFCALMMSAKMMIVDSVVYQTTDTALKFSQCLIEKMSETQFFTVDDQNSMIEVQDVMAQALLNKEQTLYSAKLLVTAFVTSLSDIIIIDNDDLARNAYRKGVYFSALEQCSLSSVGRIDTEFIAEAQRIITVIEETTAQKDKILGTFIRTGIPDADSLSYSQLSSALNPMVVQPSPMQNPPASQYFQSNDKTVFMQQAKSNYPSVASQPQISPGYALNPPSQIHMTSNFGTGGMSQEGNLPQKFDVPSVSQTGGFSSSSVSNSQFQNFPSGIPQSEKNFSVSPLEKFPNDYDTSRIPQVGSSGMLSGKDLLNPHSASFPFDYNTGKISQTNFGKADATSYAKSPQSSPLNEGTISQTSYEGLKIPQVKESSVIVIPPKTNQQFVSDEYLSQNQHHGAEERVYLPSNQESVPKSDISEFAMTSPAVIPQAQKQYPDITSYAELERIVFNLLINSDKFRKAFNSEISQKNAIKLARVLTEQTFTGYDSKIMKDALSIVTEEVVKVRIPSPEIFAFAISNALVSVLKRYNSSLSTVQSQLAANFLSSLDNSGQFHSRQETVQKQPQDSKDETLEEFYPEQKNTEQQSEDFVTDETLGQLFPEKEAIEKQLQDYYTSEIVNPEFDEKQFDFDFQSPPLSPEDRKDEIFSLTLAQFLSKSEPIRNFFCDHSEPEDVVQISFSIIKASLTEFGLHVAPLAASVASGALSELSKEGLCNNYGKTISEIIAEVLEENGIEDANAENVATKMELNLVQRQIAPTESQKPPTVPNIFSPTTTDTAAYEAVPKLQSSFTPIEEVNPNHQVETESLELKTTSDFEDQFTRSMSVLHESAKISTTRPVVISEVLSPDGVIDQKALADYLAEKFDVLESYDFGESDDEYEVAEVTSTAETEENPESGAEFTDESSTEEFGEEAYVEEKTKEEINTAPLDEVFLSSDQYEEDKDDYNPIAIEGKDKILCHQDGGEIPEEGKRHSQSTNPVQLQPSFQGPLSQAEYSTAGSQPNSDFPPHGSDYKQSSLAIARQVSQTAEYSISFIRSPNFDLNILCTQLNQLASLVDIPVLDYCESVAAIDYLLNVLQAVIRILTGI